MSIFTAAFLALTLPAGAEIYLSEGSVYAEIDGADVTLTVFEDPLAEQAVGEFRETHDDPTTARAGVIVTEVQTGDIAGYPSTSVGYTKPAMVAQLNADGEVEIVQGVETTRQIYLDVGSVQVVLTVWSKMPEVDVGALAAELSSQLVTTGPVAEVGAVALTFDDKPFSEAEVSDGPSANPSVIGILSAE
ncbi:MAG: hypothetical protein AAF415_10520 [Pseudomonadota bacterium]